MSPKVFEDVDMMYGCHGKLCSTKIVHTQYRHLNLHNTRVCLFVSVCLCVTFRSTLWLDSSHDVTHNFNLKSNVAAILVLIAMRNQRLLWSCHVHNRIPSLQVKKDFEPIGFTGLVKIR